MAAAEKFKAPEPSAAGGDMPSVVTEPTIQEESDEEVCGSPWWILTIVISVRFALWGIFVIMLYSLV